MKKPASKHAKIFMSVWSVLTLCVVCFSTTAFATGDDPITVVNNLSDFIFSAIKAIGIIILGWGIPVPVRRACDRFRKGDPCRHRRGIKENG